MGLRSIVLSVLLLTGCLSSLHPPRQVTESFQSLVLAKAISYMPASKIMTGYSSGTAIPIGTRGDQLIMITPRHVIDQPSLSKLIGIDFTIELVLAKTSRNKFVPAKIEIDLAPADVIEISAPQNKIKMDPLRIATEYPRKGDSVYLVGNPGTSTGLVIKAIVAGQCGYNCVCTSASDKIRGYVLDRPIYPGHSGGIVLNTHGELIGMMTEVVLVPHPSSNQPSDAIPAWGVFLSTRDIIRELEARNVKGVSKTTYR